MSEKAPILEPAPNESHDVPHEQRRPRFLLLRLGVVTWMFWACFNHLWSSHFVPPVTHSQPFAPSESDVCLTPACVHAASEILYNLSPNYKELDPCTDFEELVCGGWREHHDLRPDQGDAFTGTIMAEKSQQLLRHILEAPYPNKSNVCCHSSLDSSSRKLLTEPTAFTFLAHATRCIQPLSR